MSKESKVREPDPRPSVLFKSESGRHIPRSMTYKEFCFYSDEGLTVQEIKFADSYVEVPDVKRAAIEAGIEEERALGWGKYTLSKPQVKRRIQDTLAVARRSSVASVRERQEILTSILRSSIADCISIVDGRMEIDLRKAKAKGSDRGIVSIKIDEKEDSEGGSSRSRSVQMANPISAIAELNKMQDVYSRTVDRNGAIIILPAEDLNL